LHELEEEGLMGLLIKIETNIKEIDLILDSLMEAHTGEDDCACCAQTLEMFEMFDRSRALPRIAHAAMHAAAQTRNGKDMLFTLFYEGLRTGYILAHPEAIDGLTITKKSKKKEKKKGR
jgi:hypothetical protein